MVKKSKRKQDIKSKLLAAVAMLMVASIMMVSSTYAWFTLSTAPEVQGITTTVGSNGSLEIALSPLTGNGSDVNDATLTTGTDWTAKNLTWGNLLNLSDSSYGLADLTLLPAQLVVDNGKLKVASPLATPNYGADGRIQGLLENTMLGGLKAGSAGYYGDGGYGIRAIGTSSTMSEQALVYKNSIAAIKSHAEKAANAASKSLTANGGSLASIMVDYARDASDYKAYVAALQALTDDLNTSVTELGEMLRAGLLVASTTIADADTFKTIRAQIESATVIDTTLSTAVTNAGGTLPAGLSEAANKVAAIATKVSAAKQAADALDATTTVAWSQISPIVTNLMNVESENIIIRSEGNDYSVSDVREKQDDFDFLLGLFGDCEILLGEGSGVYYDIAVAAGPVRATVDAEVTGSFGGEDRTVTIRDAVIRTNYTGATAADDLYAGATNITANGDSASQLINVNYGFVVDFMFRTNASGSDLLLQTAGAQRVYGDSQNPETMGHGSTLTYTVPTDRVETVKGLMECINVLFFDPQNATIFGVAAVTVDDDDVVANSDGTSTITGELTLRATSEITVAGGLNSLTVGAVKDSNVLCSLPQNVATAVSAMVYLDGEHVTNADVLNNEDVVGGLNLQFASSVDLVPMENTALKNAGTVTKFDATLNYGGAQLYKVEDVAEQGATYTLDLTSKLTTEQLNTLEGATITVTNGGSEVTGAYNSDTKTITVPNVSGDIIVNVTLAS